MSLLYDFMYALKYLFFRMDINPFPRIYKKNAYYIWLLQRSNYKRGLFRCFIVCVVLFSTYYGIRHIYHSFLHGNIKQLIYYISGFSILALVGIFMYAVQEFVLDGLKTNGSFWE